jgi:hypothetical protein
VILTSSPTAAMPPIFNLSCFFKFGAQGNLILIRSDYAGATGPQGGLKSDHTASAFSAVLPTCRR